MMPWFLDVYETCNITYYDCIIGLISKNKTIHLLQDSDLTEKSRILQNIKIYYHI